MDCGIPAFDVVSAARCNHHDVCPALNESSVGLWTRSNVTESNRCVPLAIKVSVLELCKVDEGRQCALVDDAPLVRFGRSQIGDAHGGISLHEGVWASQRLNQRRESATCRELLCLRELCG